MYTIEDKRVSTKISYRRCNLISCFCFINKLSTLIINIESSQLLQNSWILFLLFIHLFLIFCVLVYGLSMRKIRFWVQLNKRYFKFLGVYLMAYMYPNTPCKFKSCVQKRIFSQTNFSIGQP